jgi:hypothetical protein
MKNEELDIKTQILLLNIIEKNGSIDDLYNLGYKYFQITQFLKSEIESGNAIFIDGILDITELGLKKKEKLLEEAGANKLGKILLPQISMENRVDSINIEEIFIPSKDELPF